MWIVCALPAFQMINNNLYRNFTSKQDGRSGLISKLSLYYIMTHPAQVTEVQLWLNTLLKEDLVPHRRNLWARLIPF